MTRKAPARAGAFLFARGRGARFTAIIRVAVILAALAFSAAASAQERAPRFAEHPEPKLSHARVARPVVPRRWPEELSLRLTDSVYETSRANFAGRYFMAVMTCGTTCVMGAIVEARTGRVITLPSISGWNDVHEKFQSIAFRHNSRLVVLSGARNEKPGDMGQHFYVLERGRLRWVRTIKGDGNFMEKVE